VGDGKGGEWQDTKYVLSHFGGGRKGLRNYLRFMEEGISLGRRSELVGGGLIRSLGGWAEVKALRVRGEKQAFDPRVLGDGDFVEGVWARGGEKGSSGRNLKRADLASLAGRVCKGRGVSLEELRSGSRRHEVVEARGELARVAVMGQGYSGAEVARFVGVTTSCITRPLAAGRREKA
jgi:hypothetical protein